ncbi:pDP238L [African swine fever virus]|uniref:PDP238L n=1 Tax=African swine fever virus TaxID=10497 RepID=A0A894KS54_ASF|nr:pDP238L [African swine fever virus]
METIIQCIRLIVGCRFRFRDTFFFFLRIFCSYNTIGVILRKRSIYIWTIYTNILFYLTILLHFHTVYENIFIIMFTSFFVARCTVLNAVHVMFLHLMHIFRIPCCFCHVRWFYGYIHNIRRISIIFICYTLFFVFFVYNSCLFLGTTCNRGIHTLQRYIKGSCALFSNYTVFRDTMFTCMFFTQAVLGYTILTYFTFIYYSSIQVILTYRITMDSYIFICRSVHIGERPLTNILSTS